MYCSQALKSSGRTNVSEIVSENSPYRAPVLEIHGINDRTSWSVSILK